MPNICIVLSASGRHENQHSNRSCGQKTFAESAVSICLRIAVFFSDNHVGVLESSFPLSVLKLRQVGPK